MKNLFVTCVIILGVALLAPSMASAQASGNVDVDITVNGFVILYYYTPISIDIPANVMAQVLANADVNGALADGTLAAITATSTGTGVLTAPNATPPNSPNPGSTATLTIQNAWSVRGLIAGASSVTIDVINEADLTHATAGTIGVSNGVCSGTCTGLNPTLGAALSGDVALDLDFSTITAPGNFDSAPTYTITATIV